MHLIQDKASCRGKENSATPTLAADTSSLIYTPSPGEKTLYRKRFILLLHRSLLNDNNLSATFESPFSSSITTAVNATGWTRIQIHKQQYSLRYPWATSHGLYQNVSVNSRKDNPSGSRSHFALHRRVATSKSLISFGSNKSSRSILALLLLFHHLPVEGRRLWWCRPCKIGPVTALCHFPTVQQ